MTRKYTFATSIDLGDIGMAAAQVEGTIQSLSVLKHPFGPVCVKITLVQASIPNHPALVDITCFVKPYALAKLEERLLEVFRRDRNQHPENFDKEPA
jgi:hypothetical protein